MSGLKKQVKQEIIFLNYLPLSIKKTFVSKKQRFKVNNKIKIC